MKKILLLGIISWSIAQKIIIPMDQTQNDHLKAYGIAYFCLTKNTTLREIFAENIRYRSEATCA